MNTYRFELMLEGDVAGSLDSLYDAGWDDAGISGDDRVGYAEFERAAPSAIRAVTSAIEQGEKVGLRVTGVNEDLVTLSEIAARIGRTLAAVDNWLRGKRGPGNFPAPRTPRPRGALYSWADVSAWLSEHGLAELDATDMEIAHACALIDSALKTRDGLRQLPPAERNHVARLVA